MSILNCPPAGSLVSCLPMVPARSRTTKKTSASCSVIHRSSSQTRTSPAGLGRQATQKLWIFRPTPRVSSPFGRMDATRASFKLVHSHTAAVGLPASGLVRQLVGLDGAGSPKKRTAYVVPSVHSACTTCNIVNIDFGIDFRLTALWAAFCDARKTSVFHGSKSCCWIDCVRDA